MPRVRIAFFIITIILWGGFSRALLAQSAKKIPITMSEWNGEFFDNKQGGLYIRLGLKGFKGSKQTSYLTGNVQAVVFDRLNSQAYTISLEPMMTPTDAPRQLWKSPSGKYDILQISMVDQSGVKRVWRASQEKKSFAVKRQCLSNLGVWMLSPAGASGLSVEFKAAPNSYREEGSKRDSSVAVVLDGFTGLIQEKFGGKKVLKGAEDNHAGSNEMRATIRFTRQIAMFFSLNLFRHNVYGKQIANVLQVYDPNLRRCYTDRLEYDDTLRGDIKFTFLLSKQTGTMSKLKASGGALQDPKLIECLYKELGHIQFPAPDNMVGELIYTFDAK